MAAASPCAAVGSLAVNAKTRAGHSLGLTGTLDKLLDEKVVSAAGSVPTCLKVITVADPGAAFSLAKISRVSEV